MSAEASRRGQPAAVPGQEVAARPRRPSVPAEIRRRRAARRSAGYFFLVALAGATVYPFVWMLLTSVRRRDTVFGGGFVPDQVTFGAYGRAWSQLDYLSHFLTSVVVTSLTVAGVLALATLAGYSFAKLDFPGKQVIYVTLLSTLMMPLTALILPLFLQMKALSLLNTRQGLILVYIGLSVPFAMFLMRAFFETLPDELIQAARVDGPGSSGSSGGSCCRWLPRAWRRCWSSSSSRPGTSSCSPRRSSRTPRSCRSNPTSSAWSEASTSPTGRC
jgi:ABC-type Fe3+ transport system permease subunit